MTSGENRSFQARVYSANFDLSTVLKALSEVCSRMIKFDRFAHSGLFYGSFLFPIRPGLIRPDEWMLTIGELL
jgi:hypothetical protein